MYHPITSDIRHSGYDGNQPLPPSRGDMSLPHHQYRGGSNLSYPPAFPSMSHSAQGLGSQPMPWPSHVGPLQPERDSVQYILSGQYHHTNEARGDGMMNPTFVAHGQQSDLLSPTIHDMSRTRATAAPHSPSQPLYHPHPRQVEETLPTSPVESPLTPVSRKKSRRPKHRIELAPDQPLTTQGKPRARVFVACLQWLVPHQLWRPHSVFFFLAARGKYAVMVLNLRAITVGGTPRKTIHARMTPHRSGGALTKFQVRASALRVKPQ